MNRAMKQMNLVSTGAHGESKAIIHDLASYAEVIDSAEQFMRDMMQKFGA